MVEQAVELDDVGMQLLPREAIVTQLAVFLDERTRPSLSLIQLKALQDIKSATERVEWKEMRNEARRMAEVSVCGVAPHPLLSDSLSLHKIPPLMSPLTLEPPSDVAPGFFVSPKGYKLRSSLSGGGESSAPRTLSFENGRPPLPAPFTADATARASADATAPRGRRAKAFSSSSPFYVEPSLAEQAAGVQQQLVPPGVEEPGGGARRRRRASSRGEGGGSAASSGSAGSSPEAAGSMQVGALVLGLGREAGTAKEHAVRTDSELSVSVTLVGSPPGARSLGSDTPPQAGGPLDARAGEAALREEVSAAREEANRWKKEAEELRARVRALETLVETGGGKRA
ncbi:hypothetical protein T484DRAFT_1880280, partial [Baffinella frigidus]